MSDQGPASEYGGKTGANGFQPVPPHVMTASEKLRSIYTTGTESGTEPLDGGVAFAGLLPESEQRAIREAEGVLDKGQLDVFETS